MTIPPGADRDPAILDEIRRLTRELSDVRARSVLQLNPQPLPPDPPSDVRGTRGI